MNGLHTGVYNIPAAAAGASNVDATYATEPVLRSQNSHLIVQAPFKVAAVTLVGVSVTRGRWQIPKINFFGEPVIMSANRSLQPPANPQWDYWGEKGFMLPQGQEVQLQISNNLGAATEIENGIVQLVTPDWKKAIPEPARFSIWVRATAAITPTLNAWSGGTLIVPAQSLLGGTYGIRRCIVQGTNAVAWRFVMARPMVYSGYPLRPGDLIQNAVGDQLGYQLSPWDGPWGRLGYFSTLELPQIEVFGTVAGAITYQIFMLLDQLTEDTNAVSNYVQS